MMSEAKPMCGACCCPIGDRYIMRVADNLYHEHCLTCCVCGCRLSHSCFTRDAKLYCRLDYHRIYVKKCLGCGERVGPDELVMRALDAVFHLRCFVCVVCGARLQKGDQFVVKQGQLFCRLDYEKEVEMLQGIYVKKCLGCGERVGPDELVMRALDAVFHLRCFVCVVCGARLQKGDQFVVKQGQLFCRLDYEKEVEMLQGIYVKKCLGCGERVGPDELVMRALDAVFHLRCFVCVVCGARLQKGDQFVVKQGQLFCRLDYEKEVEMLQGYTQALGEYGCEELVAVSGRSHDGRRGPKRPRTILTTQQRRAFKASFELSPKPCRKVREGLAKDTGLSVRIVQVWFQNQRAKMKKLQKKQRLDNKAKGKDEEDQPEKMKMKEEDQSPMGGVGFLNDSCSDTELGLGLTTDMMSIKREKDQEDVAFYKSMLAGHPRQFLTAEGAVHHRKLEPGFLGFPGTPGPDGLSYLTHPTSGLPLNPIDRLYSMQTSYFCGEDCGIEQ